MKKRIIHLLLFFTVIVATKTIYPLRYLYLENKTGRNQLIYVIKVKGRKSLAPKKERYKKQDSFLHVNTKKIKKLKPNTPKKIKFAGLTGGALDIKRRFTYLLSANKKDWHPVDGFYQTYFPFSYVLKPSKIIITGGKKTTKTPKTDANTPKRFEISGEFKDVKLFKTIKICNKTGKKIFILKHSKPDVDDWGFEGHRGSYELIKNKKCKTFLTENNKTTLLWSYSKPFIKKSKKKKKAKSIIHELKIDVEQIPETGVEIKPPKVKK